MKNKFNIIRNKPTTKLSKKVKFIFSILVLFFNCFLFSYSISEAKSGCCSHHGGVCGCGCCDGTSLSATCAPYYPECNSKPSPTPKPIPKPTSAPKPTPTPKPMPVNSEEPSVNDQNDQIINKIDSVKQDYVKHHQGFRESLVNDIANLVSSNIDVDKIGFYVYTLLPDIK